MNRTVRDCVSEPCLGPKALDENAAGASAGLLRANGSPMRRLYLHNAAVQLCAIHAFHCCLHVRSATPDADGCRDIEWERAVQGTVCKQRPRQQKPSRSALYCSACSDALKADEKLWLYEYQPCPCARG